MDEQGKTIHVKRVNPQNLRPQYANDFSVVGGANELYLTFSIIEPPAVDATGEIQLGSSREIDAVAVSRLIVSREFAEAVVQVLSANLGRVHKGDQ